VVAPFASYIPAAALESSSIEPLLGIFRYIRVFLASVLSCEYDEQQNSRLAEYVSRKDIKMVRAFSRFRRNQSGATVVEYGLLTGLIAAAIVGGARAAGVNISTTLNTISAALLSG
jgi:pilus assembly protein Flp/PilA